MKIRYAAGVRRLRKLHNMPVGDQPGGVSMLEIIAAHAIVLPQPDIAAGGSLTTRRSLCSASNLRLTD